MEKFFQALSRNNGKRENHAYTQLVKTEELQEYRERRKHHKGV